MGYSQRLMPPRRTNEPSALVAAAEQFDDLLGRFAALSHSLEKGSLASRHGLKRASETLDEIAACEEELQARARALVEALGVARDAQQAQAELVRTRAVEIKRRSADYDAIVERFEAIGGDAADLNAMAQALVARRRISEQALRPDEIPSLLAELDELQERMTAVATTGEALAADARAADFEEMSRKTEALHQQLLSARNRIRMLRAALGNAIPKSEIS